MNRKYNDRIQNILTCMAGLSLMACSQLVEVDIPKNQLTKKAVFTDSAAATSALVNVYVTYEQYISVLYPALYTDELIYPQSNEMILEYYQSRISPDNATNRNYWSRLYSMVYQCNAVIEQAGTAGVSDRLLGEAHFLRAYTYLCLQNFYGSIPLILTTDVSVSSSASLATEQSVYNQVMLDLEKAREQLPAPVTGTDNLRANRMAATALLARASGYAGLWEDAERYATELIQSPLYRLEAPNDVFNANSAETIFQLASQNGAVTGVSSLVPSSPSAAPSNPLSPALAETFEPGDLRRAAWIGESNVTNAESQTRYYYCAKYRNRTGEGDAEHMVCIRLAEMYLIRAEARARMDQVDEAMDDVNTVRGRADLPMLDDPADSSACLTILLEERRKELFLESAHRLFDLRRFDQLDSVIGAIKPTWRPDGQYFPIPLDELRYNPNLMK